MSPWPAVAVFGSSQTLEHTTEWEEAESVGASLANAGYTVITGGYGGTMEAVSRGAASIGGHVVGVTAPRLFPGRHGANPHVAELIETQSVTERIGTLIERAQAVMALPGSIGTAAELLIAWNVNHIARRNGGSRLPTVAIGPGWAAVAESLTADIGAHSGDIHLADTAAEGLAWLLEELQELKV